MTSPVSVQQVYSEVAPGEYLVVVKDSHNCTDTASVTVEDAVAHNYEITVNDVSCSGNNNGTISISVDGGNGAGYSFAWSGNVSTTNTATSLSAGIYSITVTDPNECTVFLSDTVLEPEMPFIGSLGDFAICEGQSATLNAGGYASYLWNTDAQTQTIIATEPGEYSVTVTSSNNCRSYATANVTIREPFTGDKLAIATVTETNSVKLYWKKTDGQGTALYRIYRDSGNGFERIASTSFNADAIYEDTTIDASVQYYKYKVTAQNNCGDECEIDEFHRTIRLEVTDDNNDICYLNWSPYQGVTETFFYVLAGDSPESLEIVDSTLFSTYNYIQMNEYEYGTYFRIMIKMSHPCEPGDGHSYDRIYSNIARGGGSDPITSVMVSSIANISAFPNPFDNEITISFDRNYDVSVSCEVVNSLGQIVFSRIVADDKIVLGSELNPGVYYARLCAGSEVKVVKIEKM